MASKILTCSYGPNTASLTPLEKRQIGLLNQKGAQDIRQRVGRLVSKHLNYQGKERFEAEVTKTKVTFTVGTETRVLEYKSNKWQLTTNGTTAFPGATDLDDAVQADVTRVIDEVLDRINNAARTNFDDDTSTSRCSGESLSLASEPSSTTVSERLIRVEERLARLEEALLHSRFAPLGHDSNMAPQLAAVQAELRLLSTELQRLRESSSRNTSIETDERRIADLEREAKEILARVQKQHEGEMLKAQGEIQRLKDALCSLEKRFSKLTPQIKANVAELKALREKEAQAQKTLKAIESDHAEQTGKLEAQLTAYKTALKAAREENEEAQTKAKAEIGALLQQIANLKAENETAQQSLQRANEDLPRKLAAAEKKYDRLEEVQTAALAERTKLAQENDALRAQLNAASKAKAELETRLKSLEESSQTSEAGLLQQNSALKAELKAQAESLEAARAQLAANQTRSVQQAERMKALEAELAAGKAKIAEMQKEKEQQAEQMAKLAAEKEEARKQFADQQARIRTLLDEKQRAEQNLTAAEATIDKQSRDLEALRKRLEELRAEKERQVSAAHTQTTRVTEETARTASEVASLLEKFAATTKKTSSSGANSTGSGSKV
ncbi:MAG: hypothetical protein JSS10_04945 [Verrucomicrobia bacterium]|nr:hypothetical protein [Verrucomicrobiota bacterium]